MLWLDIQVTRCQVQVTHSWGLSFSLCSKDMQYGTIRVQQRLQQLLWLAKYHIIKTYCDQVCTSHCVLLIPIGTASIDTTSL